MEFEDLDEEVKRECRRVAAAFGVKQWKQRKLQNGFEFRFDSVGEQFRIHWWISHMLLSSVHLLGVEVVRPKGQEGHDTWLGTDELTSQYEIRGVGKPTCSLMAEGLYRLGIQDEYVLAALDSPLSAHEKLELRLSMPREFWPQKWIDEEDTITKPLDSQ